ncbi:MAG: hypothetical protein ACAI38_17415 [Myxococcota bacterium]|nr:hypothetical protein [Myxococcota bacterium]
MASFLVGACGEVTSGDLVNVHDDDAAADGGGDNGDIDGDAAGGDSDDDNPSDEEQLPPGPTDAERTAAATATAQSTTNACADIHPFYWEVGRSSGATASGSVGAGYDANTELTIASASKWFYGAYVIQRRAGLPTEQDIHFLTFKSGYTGFGVGACPAAGTIDGCLAVGSNGDYIAEEDGFFRYGGGHMQKHASLIGLGAMKNAELAAEVRGQLGSDVPLSYNNPQPAGGGSITPAGYAVFLRKLVGGELHLAALLGSHAVCTNPLTCDEALGAPVPGDESWHYSLGHWVEDDPVVGDGAFSSPGAFGLYPWVDAGKTTYGIIARQALGGAISSADCGRLVRKAWLTALPQ